MLIFMLKRSRWGLSMMINRYMLTNKATETIKFKKMRKCLKRNNIKNFKTICYKPQLEDYETYRHFKTT